MTGEGEPRNVKCTTTNQDFSPTLGIIARTSIREFVHISLLIIGLVLVWTAFDTS